VFSNNIHVVLDGDRASDSLTLTKVELLASASPQPDQFPRSTFPSNHRLYRSATTPTGTNYYILLSAKMAPKKNKRTADSINSRLALVMKSGKYVEHSFLDRATR